jgi:aldose 1-epimerase
MSQHSNEQPVAALPPISSPPVSAPGSSTPLSGGQYALVSGEYRATVASVGASLRVLTHRGNDLVVPFDADEVRPGFRGAVLAPWPNRIVDGHYEFEDTAQQLALTEPARGHALHGLAAWDDWALIDRDTSWVELGFTIQAQAGYPHRLNLVVRYELDDGGLLSTVTATNTGPNALPYGTGPHPYLIAGAGRVDDWTLELPADLVLTVTPDRLSPVDIQDVASAEGGVFDFRVPEDDTATGASVARRIADTFIDHAFTGLGRDAAGLARVRVLSASGTGVEMTWGPECSWVQVHTADNIDPRESRRGLAVEPMTCPPDAFNSGRDLIVLLPGDVHTAGWRIAAFSVEQANSQ